MTTVAPTFARYFALPIVSAGIIGGAALGMAGMANAAPQNQPTGPGHSYAAERQGPPRPRGAAGLAQPPRREPHRALGPRLPALIGHPQTPSPKRGGRRLVQCRRSGFA